jgi:hypothetical protein
MAKVKVKTRAVFYPALFWANGKYVPAYEGTKVEETESEMDMDVAMALFGE